MLTAIVDSYSIFVPAEGIIVADVSEYFARKVADSFRIGVQISSPLIVAGLAYYVGLGIMGRLMPQLPVFFFGMPIQIAMQFSLFMLSLSTMMLVFLRFFTDNLLNFVTSWG